MLTIRSLRLRNWKPYRGDHSFELGDRAYAIVARDARDESRSNWAGKSSIVEAVEFALYGRLPPDARRRVDWISRGEKSGEVELVLSDGSRVLRQQGAHGSEKLTYESSVGLARQDEAQAAVVRAVGLSREDFAATRCFRQGEMARLVTLDPGPRLDLVVGWLRLGPVQDCEDDARGALREVARRREGAEVAAKEARDAARIAFESAGVGDAPEDAAALGERLRVELEVARGALADARAVLERAEQAAEAARARAELTDSAAAYDAVVEEGKGLAAQVAAAPDRAQVERLLGHAEAAMQRAAGAAGEAEADERRKRQLARGQFDGGCPLAGAPCPARAFVEGHAERNERTAAEATARARRARDESLAATRARSEASAAVAAHDRRAAKLEQLRAEARRLKPARERWEALARGSDRGEVDGGGNPGSALAEARAAEAEARSRLARLEAARGQVDGALARAAAARGEAARQGAAQRVAAAAAQVFGGAQRRLGEGALSEVEQLANEMLARAEVGLSIRVSWERAGAGPATSCAACGEPFPRSERVRVCARCGAVRGQAIQNKLEIEPSAQSGGARDLAGVFLQLSAGAWLTADRGAAWASALLDEPLAALDSYHRRAVSARLPELLRVSGCAQALVIGHDRAALDALPGRVLVTSDRGWSRAEIVA